MSAYEHKLGDTLLAVAVTHNADGVASTADADPTVTVFAGGSAVPALTDVLMTELDTGHYRAELPITSEHFAVGDLVEVVASAVMDEAQSKCVLWAGRIVAQNSDSLATIIAELPGTDGDGAILIDHNYGGVGRLKYKTAGGAGIDNAVVQAFFAADYDAGLRSAAYVRGETRTTVSGAWRHALALDPGQYTLIYYKQGVSGPDRYDITVS